MVPEEWLDGALCASDNPDLFFPEDYRTSSVLADAGTDDETELKRLAAEAEASAVGMCMRCPVRMDCLTYALENDERYGIYGGATARDRRRIKDAQAKAS